MLMIQFATYDRIADYFPPRSLNNEVLTFYVKLKS